MGSFAVPADAGTFFRNVVSVAEGKPVTPAGKAVARAALALALAMRRAWDLSMAQARREEKLARARALARAWRAARAQARVREALARAWQAAPAARAEVAALCDAFASQVIGA